MAGQKFWGKACISTCLLVILLEGPEWERVPVSFLIKWEPKHWCLGMREARGQVVGQKWLYSGARPPS